MNIPKAYTSGFLKAAKLPRMMFIIYLANIFTALLLALPFMDALKKGFGQSAVISDLVKDFNFTAIANLLYYNGDGILTVFAGIKWLILAYFLMNIFLTGGIIGTYNKDSYTNSHFFGSGAYNFFRFLGLNLFTFIFQAIFFLAIYISLFSIIDSKSSTVDSELTLYYLAIGAVLLHGIIFLIISMISDYGKFYLVLDNSFNIFKGFWKGTKYVFSHFFKTFFLYLFLLIIPAAVMYAYLYFQKDLKMAMGIGILIVFLVQQAFIFLRCFLRSWILSSEYQMYAHDFVLTDPVQGVILKVFDQSQTKEIKKTEKEKTTQTATTNEPTGYAIDFNSTFSTENDINLDAELDNENDKVISEEEILQKLGEINNNLNSTSADNSENSPSIDLEAETDEQLDNNPNIETVSNNVLETDNPVNQNINEPPIDLEAETGENDEIEQVNETVSTNVLDTEMSGIGSSNPSIESETETETEENNGYEQIIESAVTNELTNDNSENNETVPSIELEAEIGDDEQINETVNTNVLNTENTGNDETILSDEIKSEDNNELTNESVNTNIENTIVAENQGSNEIDENAIAEKMMENLGQENQQIVDKNEVNKEIETTNQDKTYNAGETVEFSDESMIEQKMAEQFQNVDNTEQIADSDIEQKMMNQMNNQGTVHDDNYYIANQQSIKNHNKNITVLEVNTVAEQIVKEHNLQGVSMVADDIDGEAILDGDIDSEVETDIMLEDFADNDDMDTHLFEVVQQNVTGNIENSYHEEDKFKRKKKNKDDVIEFEL